ncbi:GNAT family N-acetyltransferase [Fusobacterium sp.]|uniref:GNAT family N-acetyltransferase n=1 Tax=Fusobacterium sp. TaxID=68766 RepID=UPI0026085B7E|nr:GNAT family N-acetyltransferase [Fusobacterium sp.]MEE1475708.1 GNAT family N-acetyltransferase [Fusobacterium sp.]
MIKKFDGTIEMVRDVMTIDSESFKDIDCSAETLCKRLEKNKQYELYVKYEKDIPMGYLGLLYVANLHYDGVWVDLIAVRKEWQNKGIGQELLKFAQERAKENGIDTITGLVKRENLSSSAMFKKEKFNFDETGFILYIKGLEK